MFEHRAFDGKNWFYGTAFRQDKEDSTIWWFYDDIKNDWIMVMTPEMWSGLHDKNNKKIYERDVISNGKRKGIVWCTKGEFWVEWLDGEFYQTRLNMLHQAYEVINNTTELEISGEYYEKL